MDATLKLKNKPNIIGAASNFTYHWGVNSGLNKEHATRLAVAVSELVTDVVLFAFGELEGEMEITYHRHDDWVEVILHELGEPFNPDRYRYDRKRAAKEGDFVGAGFELVRKLTDDFIYLNKGKLGKEFRLVHHISTPHIADIVPSNELAAPAEPEEEETFDIQLITPEDAEDISKLIYRTYRHSYHKDKLYFPRQIALSIANKEKFGAITRTSRGEPAGYFAVLRSTDSDICEVGEAVVAVKHRRKGLMKKMLGILIENARERGLKGAFGEATAAHTISQRVNARFGFHSTALLLAISPSMALAGFEEKAYSQDVCSVVDFLRLVPVPRREVYLPAAYRSLLLDIYKSLEMEVADQEPASPPDLPEFSILEVEIDYDDKNALIIVRRYGRDFVEQVEQTLIDLDNNGVNTAYIDLPLFDPRTPGQLEGLTAQAFIFAGLMPLFHQEKDYLRLQRLKSQLDFSLINTYSGMAGRIKRLIKEEYDAIQAKRKKTVSES